MSLKRKEIFEFGEFRLDVDEHTIERKDGHKNGSLTGKAFQLLVFLVRRRGHLVSKDELIQFVWPDTIVEENNLEKCVHHLRQFLGETSNGKKYIETVRKHGYRFVGDVEVIEVSSSWLPETFRIADVRDEGTGPSAESIIDNGNRNSERTGYPIGSLLLTCGVILALIAGLAGLAYYFFLDQENGGTSNEEANRFYLLAVNLSEERGVQNVLKSLEYLDQAVALDPNYAIAWAAKAHAHRDVVGHTDSGQHEHYQKSMEALNKALAIDPNSSDAYSALCHNKNRYEYDPGGAEKACKRALELDPDSPVAHKTYANFLYTRGRFDEAMAEIKAAMDLQPVSYQNQQIYGLALYFSRRYDEAEAQFKRIIELNPNHTYIYSRIIIVLEEQGKESEAFEYLAAMLTIQKEDEKLKRFKTAYQTSGWRGVTLERVRNNGETRKFQTACLYARIGDKDKALEYLEKAYQERSFQIAILNVEPQLDSLRSDPRFADLVRRVEGK